MCFSPSFVVSVFVFNLCVRTHFLIPLRTHRLLYNIFVFTNGKSPFTTALATLDTQTDEPMHLVPETAPELKSVFTKKLVDLGERFSLRCVASGNPLPRVTWALDGGVVGESHRVHYGDFVSSAGDVVSYVNVTSSTRDDGGLYRCEASNELGSAWHDDRIDVRGPPRVRPMGNLTVTSGTTLVYHCPFTGHPAPKVTWSRGRRTSLSVGGKFEHRQNNACLTHEKEKTPQN